MIRAEQRLLARGENLFGMAVVDHRRREQPDASVAMLVVVIAEEWTAEAPAILDTAEAVGELWAVLHRLELRL